MTRVPAAASSCRRRRCGPSCARDASRRVRPWLKAGARPPTHPAGRVGKTSIVCRYCRDEFSDKQQSTIQASHLSKRVTLADSHVTLNVWVST